MSRFIHINRIARINPEHVRVAYQAAVAELEDAAEQFADLFSGGDASFQLEAIIRNRAIAEVLGAILHTLDSLQHRGNTQVTFDQVVQEYTATPNYAPDPLNRSTSVAGNLYEDVLAAVKRELAETLKRHQG